MKKTIIVIILTAVATNLIWFGVAGCLFTSCSRTTITDIPETRTNNFIFMVMRDLTTQSFTFSFKETGRTPTNFVATNRISLTRPLHSGQEFTISVRDAPGAEPRK